MSGDAGHLTDSGDKWVKPKHPFIAGGDARCVVCNQPESNAGHPPLEHEAPDVLPTLDEQMSAAVTRSVALSRDIASRSRKDWTREQWVAEAEEIMNDIDGSVLALLNGHILALFEELNDLRRRIESGKALRTVDLRTILRATPVIAAAQEWLKTNEALWNEADGGKGVGEIPNSPHFRPSVTAIAQLQAAITEYNAAEEADGNVSEPG